MTRHSYPRSAFCAVIAVPIVCATSANAGIEASARVSNAGHIDGGSFTLTLPRESGDRGFPITWDFASGAIGQIDTAFVWEGDPGAGSNQYLGSSFSYHNTSDETFNLEFLSRVDTLDFGAGSTLTSGISLRVEDTDGDGSATLHSLSNARGDGMMDFGSFTIGVGEHNGFGLPSYVLTDDALSHTTDGPITVDTPLESLVTYESIAAAEKGSWNTLVLQTTFSVSAGDTVFFDFRLDVDPFAVLTPSPGAGMLLGFGAAFGASRRRRA